MSRKIKWLAMPFVAGIVSSLMIILFVKDGVQVKNCEFVINAIILCAATFSGFILTSLSILLGLSTRPVMQDLRNGTGLDELRTLYCSSLTLGFITIVMCIVIGATVSFSEEISKTAIVISVGIICAYLVSTLITGYALLATMNLLSKDKPIVIESVPNSPKVVI